ncbi:MAG TPA: purine phosphorylase, partial [Gammaproteobacteria bacterium]|nr:purine phosphorylase [Gammaproteobacteria bacterium]
MLGIVAALPAEARSLTGQRVPSGQAIRLGGATLLYVSGMGQARARSAADQLLRQGAQALVSWGTAGALERTLTAGTLILPTTVTDLTRTFYVDPASHRRIRGTLKDRLPVRTGTLIQSTKIVTRPEQKAELFTRTGAVAVDMESAAIGEVAAQAGVPFLVVRGIADCQSTPIPRCAVQAIDE